MKYPFALLATLVLAVARKELGDGAVALTAVSPSLPVSERGDAERIARELDARHVFVESHELEREGYAKNGPDRCFHCKSELYELAEASCADLLANRRTSPPAPRVLPEQVREIPIVG